MRGVCYSRRRAEETQRSQMTRPAGGAGTLGLHFVPPFLHAELPTLLLVQHGAWSESLLQYIFQMKPLGPRAFVPKKVFHTTDTVFKTCINAHNSRLC
jgi:hypothetical protein